MLFKLILLFSMVGFIMSTTRSSQENETSNPLNVVNLLFKVLRKNIKQTAYGICELRSRLTNINCSLSEFNIICNSFFQQGEDLWRTFENSFQNDIIKNTLSTQFNTFISVLFGILSDAVLTCDLNNTPSNPDIEAAVKILGPKLKGIENFLEDYQIVLRTAIKVDNSLVKNIERNFPDLDLPFLLSNILTGTCSGLNE
jgi:hypothetical protein